MSRMQRVFMGIAFLLLGVLTACGGSEDNNSCVSRDECADGLTCIRGECLEGIRASSMSAATTRKMASRGTPPRSAQAAPPAGLLSEAEGFVALTFQTAARLRHRTAPPQNRAP